MNGILPEIVQRFISKHVVSVEQLEILLLLSDSPDRFWSVEEVFKVIKSSPESVASRLRFMEHSKLLKLKEGSDAEYRFDPATIETADQVKAIKQEYKVRPVKVIEAIFAVPDQVRAFAEAFKFKREK